MKELTRREFVKSAAAAVAASTISAGARAQEAKKVTRYIAAYDTESPQCLAACRKIVQVHKRMEMPATFFILARTLLANPKQYLEVLDDPLFEIASHTYDHEMLRDNDFCGPAAPPEQRRKDVVESKRVIEDVFERPIMGIRPGCSFDNALREANDVLELVREAGYSYVSSLLWGPDYSMPALLRQQFNYAAEGFPEIWELPGHGWHENLLKDNNGWGPRRLTLWPSAMPEAIPAGFVKTPEDEFAVNRVFLEKALERDNTFVSLIWHPWSLNRFDPDMKMLDLTFTHARKIGLKPSRYADVYRQVSGEKV